MNDTVTIADVQRARRHRWATALRSGEYAQTTCELRSAGKYCCLGVACDLYAKETGNGEWLIQPGLSDGFRASSAFAFEFIGLPIVVKDYFGLNDPSGSFTGMLDLQEGEHIGPDGALSNINDEGASFALIATIIEMEPTGLVVSDTASDAS